MKLREKYKIERIIKEVVTENKDKTLNEIKRMVKEEIRQEEERVTLGKGISSKVGIDDIIEVITTQKLLRHNQGDRMNAVKENEQNKDDEER